MLPVDTAHQLVHLRLAELREECRREALARGPVARRGATPRERVAVVLAGLAARLVPAARYSRVQPR